MSNKSVLGLAFVLTMQPNVSEAAISFTDGKWETTFDCPEWAQGGSLICDGLNPSGSWTCSDSEGSHADQITSSANHSNDTGRGFRHWQGDGINNNGGGLKVQFSSPQKELWIRFYHRYQLGFQWAGLSYDKILYIYADSSSVIPDYKWGDQLHIAIQGGGASPHSQTGGWETINGGTRGDGQFHVHEVYLKMDTNRTDGIGRYWIDGELVINDTSVDYSGGSSDNKNGWLYFTIGSNQREPNNGVCMAVDYDDFVIYNTTPPNRDEHDNPFIGPIGGSTPPSVRAPTNLRIIE